MPEAIRDHESIAQMLFIYGVIVHTVYIGMGIVTGGTLTTNVYEDGEIVGTTVHVLEWYYGWLFYFVSILISVSVVLAIMGIIEISDRIKRKRSNDPNAGKTLELIHDVIQAKHDKICPRIEFYDSKKENQKV